MAKIGKSLKAQILSDLHNLFLMEPQSGDFDVTKCLMMALMEHHGIKIKKPDADVFISDVSDIETCFFDDYINSKACLQYTHFCKMCDNWLDFTGIVPFEVVAIAGAPKMLLELKKGKAAVEAGDFSGNNLFNAIAAITHEYAIANNLNPAA
jgi:hypothetical protein